MRAGLAALIVIGLAGRAYAQHPCDQPEQTVATKGGKIGFCVPVEDTQGVDWKVLINNSSITTLAVSAPVSTPSSSGLYYLEGSLPTSGLSRGIYEVRVYGINPDGQGPASDAKLWQIGGPPQKPQKPRITAWLLRPLVLAWRQVR